MTTAALSELTSANTATSVILIESATTTMARIINREFIPYPSLRIRAICVHCTRYFAICPCDVNGLNADPCHDFRLVFTDGACSNNGRPNATSGMGIAMGAASEYRWSIPIDDSIDWGKSRTSQRAELLAAIHGLRNINEVERNNVENIRKHASTAYKTHLNVNSLGMYVFVPKYIVVTDSRYVVDGMTKWLPEWKRNSWQTSQGVEPTNIDLFAELDDLVMHYEMMGIQVGFWKIGREDNYEADSLAKSAARAARLPISR
ncbi:ribonuclease H-like domain-containing protein [Desarmillaria tabescens]|uniref:ribonuclease H n=1 Tax=Armillaria tabescens TaxID=1929756 RepID=A0AA39N2A2_ARMTA|nr:ribonuclease H-like domain-containing protein [Desarmillaria tabescens]KAK0455566.1 ribonuclease H-like domain-containing protein [Desarmillaria tabescens]